MASTNNGLNAEQRHNEVEWTALEYVEEWIKKHPYAVPAMQDARDAGYSLEVCYEILLKQATVKKGFSEDLKRMSAKLDSMMSRITMIEDMQELGKLLHSTFEADVERFALAGAWAINNRVKGTVYLNA